MFYYYLLIFLNFFLRNSIHVFPSLAPSNRKLF